MPVEIEEFPDGAVCRWTFLMNFSTSGKLRVGVALEAIGSEVE